MLERGKVFSSPPGADPAWVRWGVRLLVAIFILWIAQWAYREGMRIRDDAWVYSRTIRFHHDIENALTWGGETLRFAENAANSDPFDPKQAHLTAAAYPDPTDPTQR